MSNVINLADKRNKIKFVAEGIDTENLLLCFNGYQLADLINKIMITGRRPDEVLSESKDLYKVGYFDENSNKILVLK